MSKIKWFSFIFLGCFCFNLHAESTIQVDDARARATFLFAKTGAVYLTLMNNSKVAHSLLSVSVHDSIADEAQIHTTIMSGDMMQMREMSSGISIGPKDKVIFQPGGMHIMLLGLKKPLQAGKSLVLTLHFADEQALSVVVPIVDMTL